MTAGADPVPQPCLLGVSNLTAFYSVACYGAAICQHQSREEDKARNVKRDEPSHHSSNLNMNYHHGIALHGMILSHRQHVPTFKRKKRFSRVRLTYQPTACCLSRSTMWPFGGVPTEAAMQERIEQILYAEGTPTQLPDDVLTVLTERRRHAQQIGPWVEGHYRPGKELRRRKR
jgi:hypothetical protein